jgi:hypothetical protein
MLELTTKLAELYGQEIIVMTGDTFRANLKRPASDPRGPQARKKQRADRETELRKANEVGIPEADIYFYFSQNFPELLYKKRSRKPITEHWLRRCYRRIIREAR